MPVAGALYRPVPRDFEEIFIRVGWGGIQEHYRARTSTVVKWMKIVGRDQLRAARAAYVKEHGLVRLHGAIHRQARPSSATPFHLPWS